MKRWWWWWEFGKGLAKIEEWNMVREARAFREKEEIKER